MEACDHHAKLKTDFVSTPADDEADQSCHCRYWILTGSSEFLGRMFSFLPAKTLLAICSRVCKFWYAEAKKILQKREDIGWAMYSSPSDPSKTSCFIDKLSECLDHLGSVPRLMIGFSDDVDKPIRDKHIRSMLPCGSSIIYLPCYGTIGCHGNKYPFPESEGDWGTSCVLFPDVHGATIEHSQVSRKVSNPNFQAFIKGHTCHADTKCILVFTSQLTGREIEQIGQDYYAKHGTHPVIAGGITLKKPFGTTCSGYSIPRCVTVSFSGPNVNAASVYLDVSIDTRDKARNKMRDLKKAGLSERRSVAFIFTCVERGNRFYGEANVESTTFHELFPNTPLVGFFGGGEFGGDNLKYGRDDPSSEDKRVGSMTSNNDRFRLSRSQSCIICLLSFG